MAHAIDFMKDDKYVRVELMGVVTKSDLESARDETNLALMDHDCSRILVDASAITLDLSVVENFQFTSQHQSRFPMGVRIALVAHTGEAEELHFAENVAQNRGVDMKLFFDGSQALDWLLEPTSS